MPKKRKLSPRLLRFKDAYLKDPNAYRAARKVGYAESTSRAEAPMWIGKTREKSKYPKLWDMVQEAMAARSKATGIDAQWVLEELKKLYEGNLDKFLVRSENAAPYYDLSKASEEDMALIDQCKIETYFEYDEDGAATGEVRKIALKKSSRLSILKVIGKHVGVKAFEDQLNITGSVTLNFDKQDANA